MDRWWPEGKAPSQGLPVCGPGAFAVLKALAFRGRHENKDAYDLHYVISRYGAAVEDVTERLGPLLDDWDARRAITYLREDFGGLDSAGPLAVAVFLLRSDDDGFKADVAGLVGRLIGSLCGVPGVSCATRRQPDVSLTRGKILANLSLREG